MNYHQSLPDAALRPYVKHFWALSHSTSALCSQRIIPCGLIELSFFFGPSPWQVSGNSNTLQAWVSGQQTSFYDLALQGSYRIFSIVFTPAGFMMFSKHPPAELENKQIALNMLMPQIAAEWAEKLATADTFDMQQKISEHYLLKAIEKNAQTELFNRLNRGIQVASHSPTLPEVNKLASEVCYSRKQLERIFRQHVGTSPKQFLRTLRFQRAIHSFAQNPETSLTALSYLSGYFDQSHMIREFKLLSGLTPKQFFAQGPAESDYYSSLIY